MGHLVNTVRFTDDQARVANSNAGLKRIMDALSKATKDHGMRFNIKITKVMRISKN